MTLTQRVLRYQHDSRGLDELRRLITLLAYKFPSARHGLSEDDRGDFALFLYDRIPGILERFRWAGKPFEAYLNTIFKWQIVSFVRRKRTGMIRKAALSGRNLCEDLDLVRESPNVPGPREPEPFAEPAVIPSVEGPRPEDLPPKIARYWAVDDAGMLTNPTMRRRLMILATKGCARLDDDAVTMAARLSGMPLPKFRGICARLRVSDARRDARRRTLQQRRNRAFLRLYFLETEANALPNGPERQLVLEKAKKCRRRVHTAQSDLASVPWAPSHQEIADALGIPKGTVDSSIYYMRSAVLSDVADNRRRPDSPISFHHDREGFDSGDRQPAQTR